MDEREAGPAGGAYEEALEGALHMARRLALLHQRHHAGDVLLIARNGDEADVDLMKEIAKRTNGACFRVPGGGAVVDYETPLKQVFRSIANHRPLVLVK